MCAIERLELLALLYTIFLNDSCSWSVWVCGWGSVFKFVFMYVLGGGESMCVGECDKCGVCVCVSFVFGFSFPVFVFIAANMQSYLHRNGPLPMSDVHHFSFQLFDALEFLHNRELIIHCDIKRKCGSG